MFILMYPLSVERSLRDTKIWENTRNCCDTSVMRGLLVHLLPCLPRPPPLCHDPPEAMQKPFLSVKIKGQSSFSGVYEIKGKLNLLKLKKTYKNYFNFPILRVHSILDVMNLTALNGSEALCIRELEVIRISLLKQSASWLLSSNNLLNQIWAFSEPLSYKQEPSGETTLAIYSIQNKCHCLVFFPAV